MARVGKQYKPNEKICIQIYKFGNIDSFNFPAALEILLQHILLSTSVAEPHSEVKSLPSKA